MRKDFEELIAKIVARRKMELQIMKQQTVLH